MNLLERPLFNVGHHYVKPLGELRSATALKWRKEAQDRLEL
jgi:hypothetical protein